MKRLKNKITYMKNNDLYTVTITVTGTGFDRSVTTES